MNTQPDYTPDDRIACAQDCRLYRSPGTCCATNRATNPNQPRRCEWFKPHKGDKDQRSGAQRWPELTEVK